MLTELDIRNLVIVERARLTPGAGLTVISGETGAGKSLLLDALELISGGRAQARLVGPRQDAATVVGVFAVGAARAAAIEAACGVPAQDGQFILRRRITAAGRSQAWINDVPVTVTALALAAGHLVEIRAQHEALRLATPGHQLRMLDAWAELEADAGRYREAHRRALDLGATLDALERGGRDSLKELDFLRFQSREFAALEPKAGELLELEARLALLTDAVRWRDAAARAADQLAEGERAVVRQVAGHARQLAASPEPDLALAGRQLGQAQELIEEAARACARVAENLQADPALQARLEERRDAWYDLMRKHGDGEAAILAAWAAVERRIHELEGLEGRRAALALDLAAAVAERRERGDALGAARAQAFTRFATAVAGELALLGMPKAQLVLSGEAGHEASELGTLRQEFLIATNPGLPAGPIGSTVSGGEAARLSLALAVVLSAVDDTPVLVFDEVDSGVGGRLGAAIGGRLARLGVERTVLAVTHTPQVAAAAQRHYRVSKRHGPDATMVEVVEVAGEQRIEELAEMLGGGSPARAQAQALVAGSGA